MLIKSADDKTNDVAILRSLLTHSAATTDTKREIEREIHNIISGDKGEKDAAYHIESYFNHSTNWAIIHDLRIVHDGWSAQIDHILVNRLLDIWVCESKHFVEGIAINDYGECSEFFNGQAHGIPSPFEQNHRHCDVLQAVFDHGAVELPKRLGFPIKPDIKSLVLVSKNARITRPRVKIKELDEILKADQIGTRIDKEFENDNNPLRAAKVIASATLKDFANRLAAMHTPNPFNWPAKFGLSTMICSSCKEPVTDKVAKFCWSRKAIFANKVFCRECQKHVPAPI